MSSSGLRAARGLVVVAAFLSFPASLPAQAIKPQATLKGHTGGVVSLTFSPDGKTLASGSDEHEIRFWDVASGRKTRALKEKDPYLWDKAAFSPDGKVLATGGWFNKVKLWDAGTRKGKVILDEDMQCPATLVAFSPDGKSLATGGVCRGEMKLFDVASGKIKATFVTSEGVNPEGVLALAFTPDSKTLASIGHPGELRLWDVASGKSKGTRKIGDIAFVAAFSPDGKTLAATVWVKVDGRDVPRDIKLWAATTGKEQATLKGHTHWVHALAFSPNGKMLASGCADGTVKLWDATTGKEFATLKGHAGEVGCVAFSPDAKTLASGGLDETVKLWDVAKAK